MLLTSHKDNGTEADQQRRQNDQQSHRKTQPGTRRRAQRGQAGGQDPESIYL